MKTLKNILLILVLLILGCKIEDTEYYGKENLSPEQLSALQAVLVKECLDKEEHIALKSQINKTESALSKSENLSYEYSISTSDGSTTNKKTGTITYITSLLQAGERYALIKYTETCLGCSTKTFFYIYNQKDTQEHIKNDLEKYCLEAQTSLQKDPVNDNGKTKLDYVQFGYTVKDETTKQQTNKIFTSLPYFYSLFTRYLKDDKETSTSTLEKLVTTTKPKCSDLINTLQDSSTLICEFENGIEPLVKQDDNQCNVQAGAGPGATFIQSIISAANAGASFCNP